MLHSESRNQLHEHGLQPVRFESLHYLSTCNRYSDAPMGVTEYLGQTKGSVLQTLKVLEKKALIVKTPDENDKRVSHMTVTQNGPALINNLPPSPSLQSASKLLGNQDIAKKNALLSRLQRTNNFKSFGQYDSCRHNIKSGAGDYFCGLTKEALTHLDIGLICREHEFATSGKPSVNLSE
jgi:DNA-binding MarR family transcriptional regulator